MDVLSTFVHLFVESAPYLLLGMFIAGLINQFLPKQWINSILGKDASVVTASLIGAPLPLCSCSVIPVAMGLRERGASKASTASFLVSTPETGVDSIGITYALMGPVMAVARPISAVFSAIVAGVGIKYFCHEAKFEGSQSKSCCKSACKSTQQAHSTSGFVKNVVDATHYGFGKLLRDFMGWLMIGLMFAAIIQTYVPTNLLAGYGDGFAAMLLIVLISIPMYICATASTPVAVGLMMAGLSPGAALVFMLTGPATNIATLMVVKQQLGKKELAVYLTSVTLSAIACGYLLNALINVSGLSIDLQPGSHGEMTTLLYQLSASLLALMIIYQYGKTLRQKVSNISQRFQASNR